MTGARTTSSCGCGPARRSRPAGPPQAPRRHRPGDPAGKPPDRPGQARAWNSRPSSTASARRSPGRSPRSARRSPSKTPCSPRRTPWTTLVTELRNDKNNKDGAKADPTTAAGPAGARHDDNRDIRPAAGTRPARAGGHARTNTSQAPGTSARRTARPAPPRLPPLAEPAAAQGQTGSAGIPSRPASAPCGRQQRWPTAPSPGKHASATLAGSSRSSGHGPTITSSAPAGQPDIPLSPFAVAYFDDPVFAADLTAALAARLHQSLAGTGGPGDPGPDPDATAEAARGVKASIERTLRNTCSCSSGCDRLPGYPATAALTWPRQSASASGSRAPGYPTSSGSSPGTSRAPATPSNTRYRTAEHTG